MPLPQSFWDELQRKFRQWHDIITSAPHGPTGGGGVSSHNALSGVTADQHHDEAHAINGAAHTGGTAVLTTDTAYVDLTDGGTTALHTHAAAAADPDLELIAMVM